MISNSNSSNSGGSGDVNVTTCRTRNSVGGASNGTYTLTRGSNKYDSKKNRFQGF